MVSAEIGKGCPLDLIAGVVMNLAVATNACHDATASAFLPPAGGSNVTWQISCDFGLPKAWLHAEIGPCFCVVLCCYSKPSLTCCTTRRWAVLAGIMLGWTIRSALHSDNTTATIVTACLNALASGTFLYVGVVDTLVHQFATARDKDSKFACVIGGVVAVSVLSTAFHASHSR